MKPDIHFGKPGASLPDWRKKPDESADDDAELSKTPPDVVKVLGFDPLDGAADFSKFADDADTRTPEQRTREDWSYGKGNHGEYVATHKHGGQIRAANMAALKALVLRQEKDQ